MDKKMGAVLRNQVLKIEQELLKIDINTWKFKEEPKSWSKIEILGHLIDSAINNYSRFIRALHSDKLIFQGYEQEKWVNIQNYQNRNPNEIIQLWKNINLQISNLISQIPNLMLVKETKDHNFHKIGMRKVEEGSVSSLAYLIEDYFYHLEHHISQILPYYRRVIK